MRHLTERFHQTKTLMTTKSDFPFRFIADGGWIDGCARLDFGNCYSSGTVKVSLTGVEIASTTAGSN